MGRSVQRTGFRRSSMGCHGMSMAQSVISAIFREVIRGEDTCNRGLMQI